MPTSTLGDYVESFQLGTCCLRKKNTYLQSSAYANESAKLRATEPPSKHHQSNQPLRKKGLVRRAEDKNDRKKIVIQLTPDGKLIKIFGSTMDMAIMVHFENIVCTLRSVEVRRFRRF